MSNVIRLNGRGAGSANGNHEDVRHATSEKASSAKPKAPAGTELAADVAKAPRARREPPARSRPNRSIGNVFRSAKPAKAGDAKASAKDAVQDAVEGAYKVVDEYFSWGRSAASDRDAAAQKSTLGGSMGRHPYATMGMYNPIAKWWYDAACQWMGFAVPWYGAMVPPPCRDESERCRREGCNDQCWCGARSCHAHGPSCGPHAHGHQAQSKPEKCDAPESCASVVIVCAEPALLASAAFTVHKVPKEIADTRLVAKDIDVRVELKEEVLVFTVQGYPKPNTYDIVLLEHLTPLVVLQLRIAPAKKP